MHPSEARSLSVYHWREKDDDFNIASLATSYAFALFDFVVVVLIVPVIVFYLLIDWNRIKAS